jgi:hypothetical protein
METTIELTNDQIIAIVETWEEIKQMVLELWERIKEIVIKWAKELWEKFVKPVIRHLFLLQLLEWKIPFRMAIILQKITPWVWLQKIGLKYWKKRYKGWIQ